MKLWKITLPAVVVVATFTILLASACQKDKNLPTLDFSKMTLADVMKKSSISDVKIIEELDYLKRHDMIPLSKFNEFHRTGVIHFSEEENDDWAYPFPLYSGDVYTTRKTIQNLLQDEKNSTSSGEIEERKHRRQTYMYSGGTVTVRVHANVPSAWRTATEQACAAWNALGYSVYMSGYSATNNNFVTGELDVTYGTVSGAPNTVAAYTPSVASSGVHSEKITILTSYTGTTLTASAKKFTMAHELGHAIGLFHTDTNDGQNVHSSITCAQPGQSDPASVMRAQISYNQSWPGFSPCDKSVLNYYW